MTAPAAARNVETDPNGEGNGGGYLYSDSIAFSGMMDDMESVLRRLRWELNMGRGGGLVRGNSGMTTTTITV